MKEMDLLKFMMELDIYRFFRFLTIWSSYNGIGYLISEKSGITDSINHDFARIRIDLYNSLSIEKTLSFHYVIILIKSVVNKKESNYYCNIFLEKGSHKDKSNTL